MNNTYFFLTRKQCSYILWGIYTYIYLTKLYPKKEIILFDGKKKSSSFHVIGSFNTG